MSHPTFVYFSITLFNSSTKSNFTKHEDGEERKSVGGLPLGSSGQHSLNKKDSVDSSTVIYSRVNKQPSAAKSTKLG